MRIMKSYNGKATSNKMTKKKLNTILPICKTFYITFFFVDVCLRNTGSQTTKYHNPVSHNKNKSFFFLSVKINTTKSKLQIRSSSYHPHTSYHAFNRNLSRNTVFGWAGNYSDSSRILDVNAKRIRSAQEAWMGPLCSSNANKAGMKRALGNSVCVPENLSSNVHAINMRRFQYILLCLPT
jgi:hypothetical protein